jgi:hypothetical protein
MTKHDRLAALVMTVIALTAIGTPLAQYAPSFTRKSHAPKASAVERAQAVKHPIKLGKSSFVRP